MPPHHDDQGADFQIEECTLTPMHKVAVIFWAGVLGWVFVGAVAAGIMAVVS